LRLVSRFGRIRICTGGCAQPLISDYGLDEAEIRATAKAIVNYNWAMIRTSAFRLYRTGEIDRAAIRELLFPQRLTRRNRAAA
jgi:hypothetical protein